jgi:hypothetical protein
MRVVVVGQEYGNGPARVTLTDRHQDVAVRTGLRKLPARGPIRGKKGSPGRTEPFTRWSANADRRMELLRQWLSAHCLDG